MKLISQSLVGRAVDPSSGLAGYIIHAWNYYQTVNAVSSSCVTLKIFSVLGLGLTVTEINIKKVQKQDLKNIKNVKRCMDGMPKSMQTRQGRYNSDGKFTKPYPYIFLHYSCKLM